MSDLQTALKFIGRISAMGDDYVIIIPRKRREEAKKFHQKDARVIVELL